MLYRCQCSWRTGQVTAASGGMFATFGGIKGLDPPMSRGPSRATVQLLYQHRYICATDVTIQD